MKSAINIPFKSSSKSPVDLLIEIGDFGFTLLWTSNQLATIDGFAVYVFEENDNQKERIESILNSSQIKGVDFNSVKIRYNYSASLLVPEKHFQASLNEQMLSLVYGKNEEGEINNDVVALKNIHNIYRVPTSINHLLATTFSTSTSLHSTSLQINHQIADSSLYCIVFHESIKVIVYHEGKLQLVQQFKYQVPNDVVYHLLNVCQQHQLNPSIISCRLSGMIVKESNLFEALYNCFLDISFMDTKELKYASEEFNELPSHFFSHLIELATCEL